MTFQQGLQFQHDYYSKGQLNDNALEAELHYCNLGMSLFDLGILNYNQYYITDTPSSNDIRIKRVMVNFSHRDVAY